MGSHGIENESEKDQSIGYYVENTVFVAVGKQVSESESVLLWAAEKFARKKMICILHIHQPPHLVTLFTGKLIASKLKQRAIKAFHESDKQKLHKLLNEYVTLSPKRVRPDRMWIENENIEEGILSMIIQSGIKWLVMGAAADKHYIKEMIQPKSRKAMFVCERAPDSCHIWFTCQGKLIYTREGRNNDPSVSTSQVPTLHSNVVLEKSDHATLDDTSRNAFLEPNSLDSSVAIEEAKHVSLKYPGQASKSRDSFVQTPESEPESLVSNSFSNKEQHLKVSYPRDDSQDSDEESQESEVESQASNANEEEQEEEKGKEREKEKEKEEREEEECLEVGVGTLSLEWDVPYKESEIVRSIGGRESPTRLTYKENFMTLPSPKHIRASSASINLEKDSHKFQGNKQILGFSSSFNSALLEGKTAQAGKARLGERREILDRIERAIMGAENVTQISFQESVNRRKAEEDGMGADRKAVAAESKYVDEKIRRKEIEEEIEKRRLDCEKIKDEHEKYRMELLRVEDECTSLNEQIRESKLSVMEFEEKIMSAVELLISFREKRDQLRIERDKATREMEVARRMKEQKTALFSSPQFCTYSLMEIDEATYSFDPSKRIGDGKLGSIYQGILRHMEVAIRMLPNDGLHGQWRFQHEVEIVSRVRHPNILMLIGICPEARSVVYEYLENGSLEDHLNSRGKYPPLKWHTRVKIATELCSALIFLHTNEPPILHGNLKPTKILLDANFISKIGDLGIFRLIPRNQIPPISRNVYTDPEFIESGMFTRNSDVYSFGIILLLLLTGRPPSGVVNDVRSAMRTNKLEMVLDSSAGNWPFYQAETLALLALRCCDRRRSNRPDLASEVWDVLEALRNSFDNQDSCLEKKETRQPPSHFICPIYKELMEDPCTAADGYTYEREAISGWLDSGHKSSPMTNLELPNCDLIPNHALQYAIQEWLHIA